MVTSRQAVSKILLLPWLFLWPLASIAQPAEEPSDWQELQMESAGFELLLKEVIAGGPHLLTLDSTPYRSEGKLEGCGYSYQVLLRDWAYRSNQPTVAYGSVVYFAFPDRSPVFSLRIGLTDIERRGEKLWQRTTSVNYAYLRWGKKTTAGTETSIVDGEDGAKAFSYADPQVEMMEWLALADPLTIAFNREPDSLDVEFDVPIMFSDAWLSVGSCLSELAGF